MLYLKYFILFFIFINNQIFNIIFFIKIKINFNIISIISKYYVIFAILLPIKEFKKLILSKLFIFILSPIFKL